MKCWIVFVLVLASVFVLPSGPSQLFAQVCKDEEGMVTEYKKTVADLVETVKKESLMDFQKAFHQRSVLSKMTFFGSVVDGMINCLQKRANDPATLKADSDAAKGKIDAYTKLKDTIKADRDALKAAQSGKEAKALIEKFAFTG
jgi:hypothetical protein